MAERMTVEFELDEQHHCELCREAERLGVSPAEVARRAVAAWLIDIADNTGFSSSDSSVGSA